MSKRFKLLKFLINIKGRALKKKLDRLTMDPRKYQKRLLKKILKDNAGTEYGQAHHFSRIDDEQGYGRAVPINKYHDLEPCIEKIKVGQKNVLTKTTPLMFSVTSGTTDKPKYIPVTEIGKRNTASFSHQWLYRSLLDHPDFLDYSSFCISGSAIEGQTKSGIPYGSTTGLIYKSLPRILHSSYVLPFIVSNIENYDLKYYVIARLALEKDVSFIATPNPITLIRIAETGIKYQEQIIESICNGVLFAKNDFNINENDLNIINWLNSALKPSPSRARYLSEIKKEHGSLLPCHCFKNLRLIGCWLGGSIGFQAAKLSAYYGADVAMRDLGYVASEGCITHTFKDSCPTGILALSNNFYEFIPEEQASHDNFQVLLCHELDVGKCYKIILTNASGLYRYDINDIVRVEGFHNKTPILSFVSKGDDMIDIAGEKLHVDQLMLAIKKINSQMNLLVGQFRAVPNYEKVCYEILLSLRLREEALDPRLLKQVVQAFDEQLSDLNIEYKRKRESKRLGPPCLYLMDSDWEEQVFKEYLASGNNDTQYKWKMIATKISETDKKHIKQVIKR